MDDNIADVEIANTIGTPDDAAPSKSHVPIDNMFNISQACGLIASHYKRCFEHLRFTPPMQITDGCIAEFIDEQLKITVASVRMRIRNKCYIDKIDGEMRLQVHLSDISFTRAQLEVSVKIPDIRK